MENFKFCGKGGFRDDCGGSIKKVLRDKGGTPVAISCSCENCIHIVCYQFDEEKTYNILSFTKFTEEEILPLLEGKVTYDVSVAMQ